METDDKRDDHYGIEHVWPERATNLRIYYVNVAKWYIHYCVS